MPTGKCSPHHSAKQLLFATETITESTSDQLFVRSPTHISTSITQSLHTTQNNTEEVGEKTSTARVPGNHYKECVF